MGNEFDAEEFVSTLKKARVNSINVFAKCHHGMCYYPTKVGKVHPALKSDLLGEMIRVCHREGIKVPIYLPVGWEETAAEHAEWLEVSREGILGEKKPFESGYYRWRKLCLNKDGYINYILEQTRELIDLYEVDGLWYDIVHQRNCVCENCRKSMKALGLNPEIYEDIKKNDYFVVKKFMERVYSYIKQRKPEALVFFNMSINPDGGYDPEFSIRGKNQFQTHIEIESLPSGEWGYNHFPLFVNYLNTTDKQIIGMTGKFHKAWGDHGSLKNREALEYECFRIIANGAKCCIGDQLHPRGKLDKTVYSRIEEIYSQVEAVEPWCTASEKVSEIGIFMANKPLEKRFLSDEGAMRMSMELHRPFDFIDRFTDLSKYALIILPDKVFFDRELADKFGGYLEHGGKVIATYKSGMDGENKGFIFDELGVRYIEENPYCPCYLRLNDKFRGSIEEFDYVLYEQGLRIEAAEGTKILGYLGKPYFNRTYDRFCSHCQTPFEQLTDWPAVTRNGNIIYVSNPLFLDYINSGVKVYRDIIENCINDLIDKPLLDTDLPSTAEITLRKQANRTILHIIHYIAQRKCKTNDIIDAKIPLFNIRVKVRLNSRPTKVYLAPSIQALEFEWNDGYINLTVPEIRGYQIIVVE